MRRISIISPGGHDRLRIVEAPDPRPDPGEIRIEVEAIGVNFADCITRMGLYASARELVGYPITPGFEVAGTIEALGENVKGWSVGERVMAVTLFNAYQTCVCIPADQVFPVPEDWSLAAAAGFPAVFLTAWYGLFELAHPRSGERVLVHSAAGGVGQALVQLARLSGCEVTGVVGAAHKVAAVEALAEHVIDKSTVDLWSTAEAMAPGGFDIVFDANGVATLRDSYRHLAPGGRLVVYGFHSMFRKGGSRVPWLKLARDWLRTPRFNPLDMTRSNRSVSAFNLSFMMEKKLLLLEGMRQLLAWAGDGAIRPLPVTRHPFDSVAEAHRALESGQSTGKQVLVVGRAGTRSDFR
ncbi:MAG: medium chain dehydrogenase/reductase family protein [Gammaproteobacteria bacterium]|jgi:NADPH:quinone reductase-like Zn-dependent oxidoreductase